MANKAVFNRVRQIGIIPALRTSDPALAVRAAAAILAGGIPIVEVSMASPSAIKVFEALVKTYGDQMLLGLGTVTHAREVQVAAKAGAHFVVTPGFSAEANEQCRELDIASFAGAITPTEIQLAHKSGADAVKLFPCYSMGGPRYLRSLVGQYPQVDFIASGGVSPEKCSDYIRAGACAIGVGGDIFDGESLASGDHRVFTVRARRFLDAVAKARLIWEPAPSAEA